MPLPDLENIKQSAPAQSIEEVAIVRVAVDRHGRRKLNEAVVADLMQSVASVGLLEPIIVTPIADTQELALVAGLHRLEACPTMTTSRPFASKASRD